MAALEGNVRGKMHQEQSNVLDDALIPSGDVSLQKAMREMRSRYEVSTAHSYLSQSYFNEIIGQQIDLEQLRKRLTETEAKSARTVHDVRVPILCVANLLTIRP